MSKDDNGHGLLHKAVYYGQRELVDYLLEKYPETLEVKDWVSLFFSINARLITNFGNFVFDFFIILVE